MRHVNVSVFSQKLEDNMSTYQVPPKVNIDILYQTDRSDTVDSQIYWSEGEPIMDTKFRRELGSALLLESSNLLSSSPLCSPFLNPMVHSSGAFSVKSYYCFLNLD